MTRKQALAWGWIGIVVGLALLTYAAIGLVELFSNL